MRGENEERLVQIVGFTANGDGVFLHGLEQRGLSFGWGSVDFVGQNDLAEYGALLKNQLAVTALLVLLDDVRSGYVRRHQVGGELDSAKTQVDGLGKRSNHQGFGQSGNTFEEAMAPGQHGNEQLFQDCILSDDHLVNLFLDSFVGID